MLLYYESACCKHVIIFQFTVNLINPMIQGLAEIVLSHTVSLTSLIGHQKQQSFVAPQHSKELQNQLNRIYYLSFGTTNKQVESASNSKFILNILAIKNVFLFSTFSIAPNHIIHLFGLTGFR